MLINIQLFTHDMNYTLSQRAVAYAVALAMMAGCAGLPKDAETRKLSERTDSIENRVDVFNDTGDSAFAAGNLKEAVRQYTRAFELLNPNDARKLPENAFLQEQYIRSVSALANTHERNGNAAQAQWYGNLLNALGYKRDGTKLDPLPPTSVPGVAQPNPSAN